MPIVRRYEQGQIQSQGIPNARVLESTPNVDLSGIRQAGNVFSDLARQERDKADTAAVLEAETKLDSIETDTLFNPESGAFTRKGKAAFDLPNQVLPGFDKQAKQIEDSLGSERAKLAFRTRAAQRRGFIDKQLNQYESGQREGYYDAQDVAALASSRATAGNFYNNEERIAAEIAKQDLVVDGSAARRGLSEEQIAEAKRQNRSATQTDVVNRFIASGEYKQGKAYFDGVRDQIGSDEAARIDASFTAEERRATEQAQRDADRREARAERTLAGIDRQISSGVPLTPQMWSDAQKEVKGTSAEKEFNARLASEKEIQDVLRKPFQEQLRYVQDKEAALAKGGSLSEAANVARLKATVNQNLQLLNSAPLLFDERRTGSVVAPLDFSQTGSPEFADQIATRVDSLQAMRKQLGGAVPLKPLLPQEASQLAQALDSAPAQQQAQLFSDLYGAIGDPAAYQGAMQQIAPDAPVKALAGMLAGKQAQVKTGNNWFSPDPAVRGVDVAQTLLEGEQLLSPSKGEKATDGRPKAGLYLPEQTLLQAEFQSAVGDAFKDRPSAADVAFQGVKSYYVGRAVQTGRLAADKQDVDQKLVKEAVTAVLGAANDYNGKGTVLAPWGMDEATFEDQADAAFRIQAERLGIPADRIDSIADDIGLRNAGDGTYYVTNGKNFLSDTNGQPLVIRVFNPDESRRPLESFDK